VFTRGDYCFCGYFEAIFETPSVFVKATSVHKFIVLAGIYQAGNKKWNDDEYSLPNWDIVIDVKIAIGLTCLR
jgi:hypothetical protein